MKLNRRTKKWILTFFLTTTYPIYSSAFSIGIPGVISIGDGGIKAGPGAQGTNISLPNCGGSICDTLEKTKKDVTGQTGRDNAQIEFDNAVKLLNETQASLNSVNQQIDQISVNSRQESDKFNNFKAKLINEVRIYNIQFEIYKNNNLELQKSITEAKSKIAIIRNSSLKVSKESQDAVKKIRQSMENIQFKSQSEIVTFAKVSENVVNNQKSVDSLIKDSVESFKKSSLKMEELLYNSINILDFISSPDFLTSYLNNIDYINRKLSNLESSTTELMQLVNKSNENYNQLSTEISSFKE